METMRSRVRSDFRPIRFEKPFNHTTNAARAAPMMATAQYERKTTPTTSNTARMVNPMNGPAAPPCSPLVRLTSMATPHTWLWASSPRNTD